MSGTARPGTGRAIIALVAFSAALTAVAWRQSTTRETMEELDQVARELAIAADEQEELRRQLVSLEGRPWIGAEAARRLGLRAPSERELVITSGGGR